METKLSILFYSKTSKITKDGLVPIYLRVTIDGARFEQSTQRYIALSKWLVGADKAKGNTEEAKTINYFLDALKQKVYNYQWQIVREGFPLTVEEFRKKWLGIKQRVHSVLEIFKQHNEQLRHLIGTDCSKATYGKYRTTFDHVASFIVWKYQSKDLYISKLAYSFITDFEFYLKSQKKCNHNTTVKYLTNFRKIVNICIKNGWLVNDPFFGFKMSKKEVIRDFLTEEELQTLTVLDKQFQLWAMLGNHAINLGIFDTSKQGKLLEMKSVEKAKTFIITIEQQGGSITPTMNAMYAIAKL